jgi:hypothetical protein
LEAKGDGVGEWGVGGKLRMHGDHDPIVRINFSIGNGKFKLMRSGQMRVKKFLTQMAFLSITTERSGKSAMTDFWRI